MISKAFNCLCAAVLFIAATIITALATLSAYDSFLIQKTTDMIDLVFNLHAIGFPNIVKLTYFIFFDILLAVFCLVFAFKTLQSFFLFIYYLVFFDPSKMYKELNIQIDDNDAIHKSFIELKNGKVIPVKISRIHIDTSNVKKIEEK